VSFTAPAGNGGSSITGYTVTSNPGNITATGSASPITITGLANGTAYIFTVTATNAVGTGSASSPSSGVTPMTVPGAPTGVTANAGNGQAIVSFTAPAGNGGSSITGYTVTSTPGNITATGSASPITITGLTNYTTYTFTVTAANAAGTGAASSPSNSVTPMVPPIIINNGNLYTKTPTVSLAITFPGAVSMQFNTTGKTWTAWSKYVTSKSLMLPAGDGLKTISIRFKDSKGVISGIFTDTITLDTKAPVNGTLTITPAPGALTLNWQGFSDVTSGILSYRLVMGTAAYPACSAVPLYVGTDTSFVHAGVVSGKTYYYRLCAVDNAGKSSAGAMAKQRAP
jgi:hypothetical protein